MTNSDWDGRNRIVYEMTRTLISLIVAIRVTTIRVYGADNVPDSGPVLLVSNHESNLDPLVLGWATPRPLNVPGKIELFRVPILRWLITQLGCYPVDREGHDSVSLRKSLTVLRRNRVLAVFPEGTRSRTGTVGDFSPTLTRLALREQCPVIPVAIRGTARVLPAGALAPKLAQTITVTFGAPLDPSSFGDIRGEDRLLAVTKSIQTAVARLHGDVS